MDSTSVFQWVLSGLYAITLVGIVIVVVSENRNPIRTLAWVLILLLLPAVGIIFFYFFGQDNRKKKTLFFNYNKNVKDISFISLLFDSGKEVNPLYSVLVDLLYQSDRAMVLKGSEIKIITDGNLKYESLLNDIENARHHIHMQYFLFNNDEIGKKIKSALMKKASEGVQVRFLYDNVANWQIRPSFYNEMKKSGVEVSPFLKIRFPSLRSKLNYRNHRKIVVIDGTVGYIGGMNVGMEYTVWRDTHLRIKGKGVYGLQAHFLMDWHSSGEKIGNHGKYFPPCEEYTDNLLQVVSGGPESEWENLLQATVRIVITARTYLYIQTPYFLPSESLCQALLSAAMGGVDVRLMLSSKTDSPYVDPAARSYYEVLLKGGVRIYEHREKFIHAKMLVSDDYVSVIGSANMDFRSFECNFEINCYLYDRFVAEENKRIFFEDMKECNEILLSEWLLRPWWKRFSESVMRLFAPLF